MRASTLLCAAASAVIASAADTQFVVNNFSLTCRSTCKPARPSDHHYLSNI
jgi:hypothetical protein